MCPPSPSQLDQIVAGAFLLVFVGTLPALILFGELCSLLVAGLRRLPQRSAHILAVRIELWEGRHGPDTSCYSTWAAGMERQRQLTAELARLTAR